MEGDTPTEPVAEATAEAPAPQDQPVETTATEAVSTDQSNEDATNPAEGEESFTKFNLAEVPEEYREHVEQAYKQLQGDYTRKTQETAEFRKNAEAAMSLADALRTPEGQAQIFRELAELQGYQIDDGDLPEAEDDDAFTDELGEDAPDWARALYEQNRELQEWKNSRETAEQQAAEQYAQQQQEAAWDQSINSQLEQINKDLPEPLSEGYADAVVSHALALPPDQNGMPDLRKAYEALEAEYKRREQAWAASKDAPHVATGGESASQVPSLDDDDERVKYMVERVTGARP